MSDSQPASEPRPGGAGSRGAGALAAAVIEGAAGLCEALAGESVEDWEGARAAAVRAVTLRARAAAAGPANAVAYERALEALARPPGLVRTERDAELRALLVAAADTLLTIAAVAGDCATLAAELARHGPAARSADAAGAAELAAAAARTVTTLIAVNLAVAPEDGRRQRAQAILYAAEREAGRARASVAD